jgi:hypothetical protein
MLLVACCLFLVVIDLILIPHVTDLSLYTHTHTCLVTQGWVVDREKKIAKLEALAAASTGAAFTTTTSSSSSSGCSSGSKPSPLTPLGGEEEREGTEVEGEMERHLGKMRELERELDQDLTALGE